ncbi:putative ribonuclease H-like domain-containing protein [Tanacetum coccineum]
MQTEHTNSTNGINTVSTPVSTAGPSFDTAVPSTPVNAAGPSVSTANESEEQLFERFSPFKNAFTLPPVPNISSMDNTGIFGNAYDDEDVEEEVDMNNVISSYSVPDTSFTKFHKDHPEDQVIGSLKTPVQTRHMTKITEEHGLFSSVHKLRRTNHKDFQNCLFACFLSQMEPKKPIQALKDPSWVEAMQNELLQFKLLNVWTLVDLPRDRWAIEGEMYVCQPPSFKDPHFRDKVHKVEKALYGLHQAPRAWYETLSTYLLDNGFHRGQIDKTLFIKRHKDDILLFQMSSMGELSFFLGLQVKQKSDGIFISQDKYVAEILKKFDFASVKTASTPMETNKALVKDEEAKDVDVHLYRSMIGSLIYLKGHPKLGLWYPRDSSFDLEAFSNSDYARASLDRKSTTGGCQFLGKRLNSWQYKVKTAKDKHIEVSGKSKEVGTLRYISLVVPPKNFGDEAVHKELGDRMERAATTASSLEAEQWSLGCQDTILGDVDAQTRFETTSKQFNDPPLSKVNTFGSGEDNMQLMELMTHSDTIDGRDKIITEASIRRHLKLQDSEGLTSLPNGEIFEQLTRMGFIQILLNKQQRLFLPHTRTYSTPTLTNKLFNNMRRASKGYSGVVTPLFDTMLVQPQDEAPSTSPSRITSSPSLSSHHTTSSTPTTPPSIQTTHEAEETATMPHDSPL